VGHSNLAPKSWVANCVDGVVPVSPSGLLPQGIIYTSAPSGSSTVGLITLLYQNGPVLLFNPANVGTTGGGYIDSDFLGGTTSACDDGRSDDNGCFYAGRNSACAVQITNSSGDAVGRIYPVTNQVPQSLTATQKDQYHGRLYAIDVDLTGITEVWSYDFENDGSIVGPSRASPMCSPNNGYIVTDYGSWDQQRNYCGAVDPPPTGLSCGTGIVALADCSVLPRPGVCATGEVWHQIYQADISELASDDLSEDNPYQTGNPNTLGAPNSHPYINANFVYDVTNQCFWVRPYGTATMSCLSDTTSYLSIVAAANTAFLASNPGGSGWLAGPNPNWTGVYPASNVPMSSVPSGASLVGGGAYPGAGDSLAIIGEHDGSSYAAILAIDTGVCGQSQACCTPGLVGATCASSWSTAPEIFWYVDLSQLSGSAGGAYGQFTILNAPDTTNPCLVTFGASEGGAYFLSSQDQVNGGCGKD